MGNFIRNTLHCMRYVSSEEYRAEYFSALDSILDDLLDLQGFFRPLWWDAASLKSRWVIEADKLADEDGLSFSEALAIVVESETADFFEQRLLSEVKEELELAGYGFLDDETLIDDMELCGYSGFLPDVDKLLETRIFELNIVFSCEEEKFICSQGPGFDPEDIFQQLGQLEHPEDAALTATALCSGAILAQLLDAGRSTESTPASVNGAKEVTLAAGTCFGYLDCSSQQCSDFGTASISDFTFTADDVAFIQLEHFDPYGDLSHEPTVLECSSGDESFGGWWANGKLSINDRITAGA